MYLLHSGCEVAFVELPGHDGERLGPHLPLTPSFVQNHEYSDKMNLDCGQRRSSGTKERDR